MDRYITHNSCWLVDPDAKVAARIPREDADKPVTADSVPCELTNGWFEFETMLVTEAPPTACCGQHASYISLDGPGVPSGHLGFWPLATVSP
jgi:hypothetical protein